MEHKHWEGKGVPILYLQDCKLHREVKPGSRNTCQVHKQRGKKENLQTLYELLSDAMLIA